MAEERRGWGRGEGKEREAEQERGAREGKAGRDCSQRRGQWEWGKPAGVSGRGLDVEGARHPPPEPLWFLSQARAGGRGASMGPTPGHPAWAESSALLGIPNPGLCGAQRLGE